MRATSDAAPFQLLIERELPQPPARVWSALTDPAQLARWLFPVDFVPVVGHAFGIRGQALPGWRGWTDCEVLELDPPRRMVWRFDCADDAPASEVRFELEAITGGTRLRIVHHGRVASATHALLDAGWRGYLQALADTLR